MDKIPQPALLGTAAALAAYCLCKREKRDPDRIPANKVHTDWPALGHVPALLAAENRRDGRAANGFKGMATLCNEAANEDGVTTFKLLSKEFYLIKNPDYIQRIYTDLECWGKEGMRDDPLISIARTLVGDGLFSADDSEETWGIAHRILSKPFSREGMMMFIPMMNEQADKMCDYIDRTAKDGEAVMLNELVTKMAFETIAYCGMGTTFGSWEREDVHPFVAQLGAGLQTVNDLTKKLPIFPGYRSSWRAFDEMCDYTNTTVDEIVRKRKNKETSSPGMMPDLLDLMLEGVDPVTGEKLTAENIRYQIITFLVAGHDTTASAMGYLFDFVLRDPRVEQKLMKEIQEVVGDGDVKLEHVSKLKYLGMCMKETMRLQSPARQVPKVAIKDHILGGKYKIKKGDSAIIPFNCVHEDPKVWGPDADKFIPERFEKGLPHPFAYLPFSTGPRGCLGMEFSLMEQKIAIVKLMQRYVMRLPEGQKTPLELENRVFIGPTNFAVEMHRRADFGQNVARPRRKSKDMPATELLTWSLAAASQGHDTKLNVLYGSNGGSTKDFAQKVALKAKALGFKTRLGAMDDFAKAGALTDSSVILAATYNGMPADNAKAFMDYLASAKSAPTLGGAKFAVFGCGNKDWAATYQHCPIAVDEALEAMGGSRLLPRVAGDSGEDLDAEFEQWLDGLWPALASAHGIGFERVASNGDLAVPVVEMITSGARPLKLWYEGGSQMKLAVNRELVKAGGGRSVKHIEFELPQGASYKTGDHLVVHAENDPALVKELMESLKLESSAAMRIDLSPITGEDEEHKVLVKDWLARAVDLSKGLTASSLLFLSSRASNEVDKVALQALSEKDLAQRMAFSLAEVLQRFRSVKVSLAEALALLFLMKPRLYSISSSPLVSADRCSITVGVLEVETATGRVHKGVCSKFLAGLKPGTKVWASVRDTGSSFRPAAPGTPMVLVGPGTGLAPLRGFLQEAQQWKKQGKPTGDLHLFFGCRTSNDFLYEDELKAFEKEGLVKLHVAFSRQGEKQYVQSLIEKQADAVWKALSNKGHVFVCGDASSMAPQVRDKIQDIAKKQGLGDKSRTWMEELRVGDNCRYHEDVWAGNA